MYSFGSVSYVDNLFDSTKREAMLAIASVLANEEKLGSTGELSKGREDCPNRLWGGSDGLVEKTGIAEYALRIAGRPTISSEF